MPSPGPEERETAVVWMKNVLLENGSPVGRTVWESSGTFGRWNFAGGSASMGQALSVFELVPLYFLMEQRLHGFGWKCDLLASVPAAISVACCLVSASRQTPIPSELWTWVNSFIHNSLLAMPLYHSTRKVMYTERTANFSLPLSVVKCLRQTGQWCKHKHQEDRHLHSEGLGLGGKEPCGVTLEWSSRVTLFLSLYSHWLCVWVESNC